VPAPAIDRGEFVQDIGGGVSQFATTMYNAAFLGGYEIVEHKPHSQYISRYPEGREATLDYPNVDLKFRNSSPHGLYIDTSYTGTSITVSIWATPWVQVSTSTGGRSNFTGPETIVRPNPALAPGEERVIQEGAGQGFQVTVTRTLTFPDGRVEDEAVTTTYVARPRIGERG
jgi:vancomycin resistance protein YoaR